MPRDWYARHRRRRCRSAFMACAHALPPSAAWPEDCDKRSSRADGHGASPRESAVSGGRPATCRTRGAADGTVVSVVVWSSAAGFTAGAGGPLFISAGRPWVDDPRQKLICAARGFFTHCCGPHSGASRAAGRRTAADAAGGLFIYAGQVGRPPSMAILWRFHAVCRGHSVVRWAAAGREEGRDRSPVWRGLVWASAAG